MRLAGREWRTLVSEVRLGRDRYRVVRPDRPVGHASLYEGRLGAQFSVDRAAAADLAIAWWLAARSRRSLVYLPLRSGRSTCGAAYGGRGLDLVLLHHSLGFRASRWKPVRARLPRGDRHKVTMPVGAMPRFDVEDHQRRTHRGFLDKLRWTIAAETLFLVGSRRAFELEADQIRGLAEDCPSHLARHPGTHCCAEIELGSWARTAVHYRFPRYQLHIECCNEHW